MRTVVVHIRTITGPLIMKHASEISLKVEYKVYAIRGLLLLPAPVCNYHDKEYGCCCPCYH